MNACVDRVTVPSLCTGILTLWASTAVATTNAEPWRSLGPQGGNVSTLLADPASTERAYARGAGGLFRTVDGGKRWLRAESGIDGSVAHEGPFILDPEQPTTLYVVDRAWRLYRSTDAAVTWVAVNYVAPSGDRIAAIADMPGNAGSLLIALSSGKILASNDGGDTVALLGDAEVAPTSINVDPSAPARIAVGAHYPQETVLSTDGGRTFEVIQRFVHGKALFGADGTIYVDAGNIYICDLPAACFLIAEFSESLLPDPVIPDTFYMGFRGGVARMTNHGATGVELRPPIPDREAVTATALTMSTSGDRILWTGSGSYGVHVSDSTMATFHPRSDGMESMSLRSVAIDPTRDGRLFSGQSFGDVGVGLDVAPLHRTIDGGRTWERALGGAASSVRSIALDPTTAANATATRVFAVGKSIVYPEWPQRRNNGIYRSEDGGANWVLSEDGLPVFTDGWLNTVRFITIDPRSCANPPVAGSCADGRLQTLFVGSQGRNGEFQIARSDDGGLTWIDRSKGLPRQSSHGVYEHVFPYALAIDPIDRNVLDVATVASIYDGDEIAPGTIPNGVFHSTDGGGIWTARTNGLPLRTGSATTAQDVYALVGHPRKSGWLWAAVAPETGVDAGRIYRTTDGGLNWFDSSTGIANCLVRTMDVDRTAPNVIYAGGNATDGGRGCVYRTENSGATWTALHVGLPADFVGALQRDPRDQSRLVVGANSGVWELRDPPDSIFASGSED